MLYLTSKFHENPVNTFRFMEPPPPPPGPGTPKKPRRIRVNVKNKQEIQISAKHALLNAVVMAIPDPIIKIIPDHQIAR